MEKIICGAIACLCFGQSIAGEKLTPSEAAFRKTALFAASIKKTMRDPDSLVWESIRANDDASVICVEYRARNGFGGMNREFAVYANSKVSQKPTAWNKHCIKPMNDMKHVRYALK